MHRLRAGGTRKDWVHSCIEHFTEHDEHDQELSVSFLFTLPINYYVNKLWDEKVSSV